VSKECLYIVGYFYLKAVILPSIWTLLGNGAITEVGNRSLAILPSTFTWKTAFYLRLTGNGKEMERCI